MPGTNDAKRELRRTMRVVRQGADGDQQRAGAIVARLLTLAASAGVRTVMLYEPLPGEPDVRPLAGVLRERGVTVVVPRADPTAAQPIEPSAVDLVVVPGLAFSRAGDRLGQGGGWYDRFLAGRRPDALVVGVGFDEQVVAAVPTEPHDVRMTHLVTPTGTYPVSRPRSA